MKTTPTQLAALPRQRDDGDAIRQRQAASVTNYAGNQGTIQKLDVGVDFSKQMITSYDLQAKVIGNWKASGSGSFAQFTGTSGIAAHRHVHGLHAGQRFTHRQRHCARRIRRPERRRR